MATRPEGVVSDARRAATLAEAIVGIAIFALFALAVLGTMATAGSLNQRDSEINQVTSLTQGYLEEVVMQARTRDGFDGLADLSLRSASLPHYLYQVDVVELQPGLKKVSVSVFYADRDNPTAPDTARPRNGCALTLGTALERP